MTSYNEAIRNLSSIEINYIQYMLSKLGYGCMITGTWDHPTNSALMLFQRNMGIRGDGIPTKDVLDLLKRQLNK